MTALIPGESQATEDISRLAHERDRLQRRLDRELSRRLEAESIGERATAELYESLRVMNELHEQQAHAMRRMKDLDRAKDTFLSTVSHELRTPLTSIIGYLEMISDGELGDINDEVASGVEVATRNARRLRQLVEDLLALSAFESHQGTLRVVPVDLAEVVREAHRALLPQAIRRGLVVTVETEPHVRAVPGDRDHLERVVLNLLSNALKFTPDGGQVRVDVRCLGREIVLQVADTGIGIPAHEQDQLFTRFFRSSRALAEQIQGTGLGLALVREVVDRHHGVVDIASVEGEGTTVTVRLPVQRAREEQAVRVGDGGTTTHPMIYQAQRGPTDLS